MTTMYHVTDASNYEAIRTQGLHGTPHVSLDPDEWLWLWESGPGVGGRYNGDEDVDDATIDIWAVNVDGLPMRPDPNGGDTDRIIGEPGVMPPRGVWVTPERLQHFEQWQLQPEAGWIKTGSFEEYLAGALLPEVRFTFEHYAAMMHEGAWADVAAKAKRLVQQGKVTILRNAPHHIMAHVIGDGSDNGGTPDEHDVEISRHDPNSQIIEQWNCSCAWAQYSFDRTRKWKKFEGRPCSHVLATYWKARSTPLDMGDLEPGFQVPRGQKTGPHEAPGQQKIPGMPGAPPSAEGLPRKFTPDDEGLPNPEQLDQQQQGQPAPQPSALPSTQDMTIPKAPESPFGPPPKATPQHEQLHLFDITAPPGMQPMPNATPVSVPGGRPPTPGNPVQFPGTFSHFIPVLTVYSNEFVYAKDALTDYFETLREANQPIYVALINTVALERSGGKIPMPGAMSYGTSSEGIPLYRVQDLGWNPSTQTRENADVNVLQGAPEHRGTYTDVPPGSRAEVLDFDSSLRMAYIVVPLNYPDGGDVRLHPHSLKGWVDYADIRPVRLPARTPWRSR